MTPLEKAQILRRRLKRIRRLRRHRWPELRSILNRVAVGSWGTVLDCYEDFNQRCDGFTKVQIRSAPKPFILRNNTSDFQVFRQVFLQEQYRIDELTDVSFIVDAGGNIGLSAAYLLMKYPKSKVVVVEPDSENFAVASRNLEGFGGRAELVQGAVWSGPRSLRVSRGVFRDGRHWSTQTLPDHVDPEASVDAFDIRSLMAKFKFPRIDLLKMDIEGAEFEVFRHGDTSFLANTRCCAIELHGPECEKAFTEALTNLSHTTRSQGEVIIASIETLNSGRLGVAVC